MAITLDTQIAYMENEIMSIDALDDDGIMAKELEICQAILQSLKSLREEEDERD